MNCWRSQLKPSFLPMHWSHPFSLHPFSKFPLSALHHQLSPFFWVIPRSITNMSCFSQMKDKQTNKHRWPCLLILVPSCLQLSSSKSSLFLLSLIAFQLSLEPTPNRRSLPSFILNILSKIKVICTIQCHFSMFALLVGRKLLLDASFPWTSGFCSPCFPHHQLPLLGLLCWFFLISIPLSVMPGSF